MSGEHFGNQEVARFLHDHTDFLRAGGFLNDQNLTYSCIQELVLKNGQPFEYQDLPPLFEQHRGAYKECYRNAFWAALTDDRLVYCEGYAAGIIPVAHAWCVERSTKKVVEVTWDDGEQYFGIPLKFEFVRQVAEDCMVYSVFHNGPAGMANLDFLQGKYSPEEFLEEL